MIFPFPTWMWLPYKKGICKERENSHFAYPFINQKMPNTGQNPFLTVSSGISSYTPSA